MRSLLQSARGRTIVGLAIAVSFVPIMLGITACFETKTPIGAPGEGWTDPRITGAWLSGTGIGDDSAGFKPTDHVAYLWVFRPWDDKTWMVTLVGFDERAPRDTPSEQAGPEATSSVAGTDPEPAQVDVQPVPEELAEEEPFDINRVKISPDEVVRILGTLANEEMAELDYLYFWKAWITSIGPYRYLVLEPGLPVSTDTGLAPSTWLVFRIVLKESMLELDMIDTGSDDLGDASTRGEAEDIIARHAADPEFAQPAFVLHPVPRSAYDALAEAIKAAGIDLE